MCGFAGFAGSVSDPLRLQRQVEQMGLAISHRGPDDQGSWVDQQAGLALGFRRLAIVDLSPGGHQPMISSDGRFVITFNGEIYNHRALRRQLECLSPAIEFRGQSDTEVLLAGIQHWGLTKAIQACVGMYAFALWDRRERKLFLVRDRLGEKPLFYGNQGDAFLFGSELKALRKHPEFRGDVDRESLAEFVRYGYVPTPKTIYRGVFKLEPATIATFAPDRQGIWGCVEQEKYWSLTTEDVEYSEDEVACSDANRLDEFERLLSDAIRDEMVADVPVGAFLSGGIDSSLIAAVMQRLNPTPIKTFTIGFDDQRFDEAKYARVVAEHLKTDHTELYVTGKQSLDIIPRLASIFDEPFADSSQIPTLLVAELAKSKVTVGLSGDGGDELFYGYSRYPAFSRMWSQVGVIPASARNFVGRMIGMIPYFRAPESGGFARKMYWAGEVMRAADVHDAYDRLVTVWQKPSEVVLGLAQHRMRKQTASGDSVESMMMEADLNRYLPDDILTKVDRATMAVSLESRAPFLDHRIVEFAKRLPMNMLYRDGQSKWLLRQVLYRYVPKVMVERPKQGFGVPVDAWLRGPLCDWAEALLDTSRLRADGFFDVECIRSRWEQHRAGRGNWGYSLWHILMFQAWWESVGAGIQQEAGPIAA